MDKYNKYRKYKIVICQMCGQKRSVRDDNFSKLCRSCSTQYNWSCKEYRDKCVKSHLGHKPTKEQKRKQSESLKHLIKLRGKDFWKLPLKKAIEVHRKSNGEASLKWLYKSYKRSANIRNIVFNISQETFKKITSQNCFYCNIQPSNQMKDHLKRLNGAYKFNGIDRVDNHIGYVDGNIVPCCKTCNYAKRKMSTREFIDWCNRVVINTKDFHFPMDTVGSKESSSK